ncbi:MAG TPA: integration host factor subunit alpha [Methylomicrobium sp.]|nr:integration host factor subunit alpha [Methylomicrobium sp.]
MMTKIDMIDAMHDYLKRTWVPSTHHKEDRRPTRKDASRIVESVLSIIKDTLSHGEAVMISGFGKFDVKQKHQRNGRNPQTGEEIVISSRKVIRFHSSPVLKKVINQGTSG